MKNAKVIAEQQRRNTLRKIMIYAWKIQKQNKLYIFGLCLKMAWEKVTKVRKPIRRGFVRFLTLEEKEQYISNMVAKAGRRFRVTSDIVVTQWFKDKDKKSHKQRMFEIRYLII